MLRVSYEDKNKLKEADCRIDDSIRHHYYPEWSDDEEEELPTKSRVALDREYLDSKLQKYKKEVVFQEGAWICSPQEVHQYMKILQENSIPWDKVLRIEKYGDYHRR